MFWLLTLVTVWVISGCDRSDGEGLAPLIAAKVTPEAGKTTQIFKFDLSQSDSRCDRSNKLFVRWDWNGDGIWETPFTRLTLAEHRYYAPGVYLTRAEVTNLDGVSDTAEFRMLVEQGYSPPKAVLAITPSTGHIFTNVLLDASATKDDEDSLDQLKFRWDFEGDGVFDTGLTDSSRIHHVFPVPEFYKPRVEVKDPSGLSTVVVSKVTIGLEDPRLLASFRCIPDSVTYLTPINMDASGSKDLDFPDRGLRYRWDWNNDWIWDTEWTVNPVTVHEFPEDVFAFVRLQVQSFRGLVNDTLVKIRLYRKNLAPRANFKMSTYTGNLGTNFRFDCWWCRDDKSAPSEMFYKWDFDGDGIFDTDFMNEVITFHQYNKPGRFETTLVLKDTEGETDTCSKTVYVTQGTNPTDILFDYRGFTYEYYGIVKIGDQWWYSKNACFGDTAIYYREPVTNNWPAYFEYGFLYSMAQASVCPNGWHLPTREDWLKLMANYPEGEQLEALLPGGVSDFGLQLGGSGSGFSVPTAAFTGKDVYGTYWSSSTESGSAVKRWIVKFDSSKGKITGETVVSSNLLLAVRCVKD